MWQKEGQGRDFYERTENSGPDLRLHFSYQAAAGGRCRERHMPCGSSLLGPRENTHLLIPAVQWLCVGREVANLSHRCVLPTVNWYKG